MNSPPNTPLLDKVRIPADLRALAGSRAAATGQRIARRTCRRGVDHRRPSRRRAGRGRADGRPALRLQHARRPPDLGCRPPGLSAQDPDRPARPHPHAAPGGRAVRLHQARESEYDPFGAAHSSTSISAGLGMAVARDLQGGRNSVVAVIGDGAMSAGMAYEAMNNAGALDARLIVILNDNDMSIAPPTGAMSAYLARLASGRDLSRPARYRQEADLLPGQARRPRHHPRRRACARLRHRRHAVRGARLLPHRPDRRAQSRAPDPGAEERPRQWRRPGADPCRDAEGQGLSAGRGGQRQISRRQQVRRHHRRAGQAVGQRAGLYARSSPTA